MRIAGYILIAIGALRVAGTVAKNMRFHHLGTGRHLLSLVGSLGVSFLLILGGLALLKHSCKPVQAGRDEKPAKRPLDEDPDLQ